MFKRIAIAYLSGCAMALAGFTASLIFVTEPSAQQANNPSVGLSPIIGVNGEATLLTTGTVVSIPSGYAVVSSTSTSGINNLVLRSNAITFTPAPRIALHCNDDACTVHAASLEEARDWLERIANRSVQVDIVADQNCHPQRISIPRREAEVAALER